MTVSTPALRLKERAAPKNLCCDTGSAFTSQLVDLWAYQPQMALDFSRPGKPTDHASIESFNGIIRRECLKTQWFLSLEDAQEQLHRWRQEYKVGRSHRALGDQTPAEFANTHGGKEKMEEVNLAGKLALKLA